MSYVLIVDDDAELRVALARLLRCEGFDVREAADGQDALDDLAHGPPPRLVFTDLDMPRMDGWTFLANLADNEPQRAFRIVVLSGSKPNAESLRRLGAELGPGKPFNPNDVLALARRYCPCEETSDAAL